MKNLTNVEIKLVAGGNDPKENSADAVTDTTKKDTFYEVDCRQSCYEKCNKGREVVYDLDRGYCYVQCDQKCFMEETSKNSGPRGN